MATVYAYVRVVETQSLINIDMKECLYICFFKNVVFKNTALIFFLFFQMLYRKRAVKKTKQKKTSAAARPLKYFPFCFWIKCDFKSYWFLEQSPEYTRSEFTRGLRKWPACAIVSNRSQNHSCFLLSWCSWCHFFFLWKKEKKKDKKTVIQTHYSLKWQWSRFQMVSLIGNYRRVVI